MKGHNFKKQFGQNFLRSDRFALKLLESIDPEPGESVIEIGPGDGRLTRILLDIGLKVTAVEVDYDLLPKLLARFQKNEDFELVHSDILEYEPKFPEYKVIGSLPYNISKQIIKKFVTNENPPLTMAFIVQEEVAKDYVASAPRATFLSNWISIYAEAKKSVSIPASQFHPKPKVNGAILQITPKELTQVEREELEHLSTFIRQGFVSPRKTLSNNLKLSGYDEVVDAFAKINLDPKVRPAELSFEEWRELYYHLRS